MNRLASSLVAFLGSLATLGYVVAYGACGAYITVLAAMEAGALIGRTLNPEADPANFVRARELMSELILGVHIGWWAAGGLLCVIVALITNSLETSTRARARMSGAASSTDISDNDLGANS